MNATEAEQNFDLNLAGIRVAGPSTVSQIVGSTPDAADRVGQAAQVEQKDIAIGEAPHSLTVPPISINIYRFPVAAAAP